MSAIHDRLLELGKLLSGLQIGEKVFTGLLKEWNETKRLLDQEVADAESSWAPTETETNDSRIDRVRSYLEYSLRTAIGTMETMKPHHPSEYYEQTKAVVELQYGTNPATAIDMMLDHIHKWTVRTDPSCGPYQGA